MTHTSRDTSSGKPLRRLPRPRPISVALGIAGVAVIVAGFLLQGSALTVDPSPPQGYGSVVGPVQEPAPASSLGNSPGGSAEGGLLPDASATAVASPEPDPVPTSLVPVAPGRLEDLSSEPPTAPVRLLIAALGIDAPIQAVGVTGGEMEVPPRADLVAWYRFGPVPGAPGSAVLAAHVSWGGERGAFYHLRDLPRGAEVEVRFADGSVRRFRSVALASYDKSDLPVERIFERRGEPVLTLITCGGAFNQSLHSFEQNVVAYAVPIEQADAEEADAAEPTVGDAPGPS